MFFRDILNHIISKPFWTIINLNKEGFVIKAKFNFLVGLYVEIIIYMFVIF